MSSFGPPTPRRLAAGLFLLLALFLAVPAPARAAAAAPAVRRGVAATAAPPLAGWTSGWGGYLRTRTGVVQFCIVVAAFALLILIKKLH